MTDPTDFVAEGQCGDEHFSPWDGTLFCDRRDGHDGAHAAAVWANGRPVEELWAWT